MNSKRACLLAAAWAAFGFGCSPLTDPDGVAWIEGPNGPSKRWGHTLVYDSVGDRLIVHAGIGPGGKLNDTWIFDIASGRWSELQTVGEVPPPRLTPAAVMDAQNNRMVLVGGDVGVAFASEETWSLDLATGRWTRLDDIPSPRFDVVAAVDGRTAFFYAGFSAQFAELDDLWAFDLDTNTWTEVQTRGERPASRSNSGFAAWEGQLWVTGGHASIDVTADTWRFDIGAGSWVKLDPAGSPSVNSHYAYSLDPECGTMFLTGGDDNDYYDVGLTSIWRLDGQTAFDRMPVQNFPPPRRHSASAWDPTRRRLFIFGGWQGYDQTLDDFWWSDIPACP